MPSALVEVTTSRDLTDTYALSTLPNRVALAFCLSDFELSAAGVIVHFDLPRWAPFGVAHTPFPLAERETAADKVITEDEFRAVVDLAYKIPEFRGTEGNSKEIALYRVLRASGLHWMESGFLDNAIALEAALLGGAKDELAYKFRIYGALFLKDQLDPQQTFKRLKRVYEVRSRLFHGGKVTPEHLSMATEDAAELAKAVVRKAIETGWPDAALLDTVAVK